MKTETTKSVKTSYHLNNLYLDPNNYRFVENDNYRKVDEDNLIDIQVQARTKQFIEGRKRSGITDLINSFKANGFLEVDVIQVKDLGENKYLVLEGNRRVTALKALQEDYEKSFDIGLLDSAIFKKVPFEIHNNEEIEKHLIIMGLKHIGGNKKWPVINQAQLIYDYLKPFLNSGKKKYSEGEKKLCDSLGIMKVKLKTSQRAYHLILDYKKSDYGDQFESDKYSIFEEIIKRPTIKEWLDWDDSQYVAKNKINKERLFSWISMADATSDDNENGDVNPDKSEPIITKSIEIRDLAKFIDNEEALTIMEETNSVAQGLVESGVITSEGYKKKISEIKKSIEELNRLKSLLSSDDLKEIISCREAMVEILPKQYSLDGSNYEVHVCFEKGNNTHFENINIRKYKLFKDFKLEKLNLINIFAGFNNSGKTTLLEAIYLLSKQNDLGAFFNIVKLKNKFNSLSPAYLNLVTENNIRIEGVFNKINTYITIDKFEDVEIDKKDDYIISYRTKSVIDKDALETTIHTYGFNPFERYYDKIEILCNSVLKSPYFHNQNEILRTHNKTVEVKAISQIINFIQKIDTTIKDITLTNKTGEQFYDIKRFLVDTDRFKDHSVDITTYGEGLQRVFEIAIAFAYCKNGILLIDEFETAIHKTLLIDFTRFIQELAIQFNVQVFITSHSKECIDAFAQNDFRNDTIAAYMLDNFNETVITKYIEGDRLKYLVENIDLDIRGDK